ncbi:heterokaryon incompatibility protein-domain-containing protein, partial [Ilyonectria robusta]|uniref:heterokaryon incompatibility protein-domain-containing protein n=1 Tax=Ilyonectria robusta TaxID=1079257 RepID=UPI001E8D2A07
ELRLMHVHPGNETDPVHLSLVTTALDATPDFEFISYCWGNAQDQRQVTCNSTTLSITSSLFTGLVHFRHSDQPRVLWADAVRINQADAAEKSDQALLMPDIYSQAMCVLVWLGIADDPVYGSALRRDSLRLREEGKPNVLDHDWMPLARPWFRRKWVVQEVSLARQAVFRQFSIAMLVEGRSLKLLSLAPDRSLFSTPDAQRLEGLPSW